MPATGLDIGFRVGAGFGFLAAFFTAGLRNDKVIYVTYADGLLMIIGTFVCGIAGTIAGAIADGSGDEDDP